MKKFKFNKIVLAMVLTGVTNIASAALSTGCTVMPNDNNHRISARANFPTAITGDLYVATKVNGQFLFFAKGGQETSLDPLPFAENKEYSGDLPLFDFSAAGINPGRYPLFQVVTNPGTDPLDFRNWVGGLSGLSSINFNVGLPVEVNGDFNGDCFADDDLNRDGFHDSDRNRDGFRDDDRNRDGFRDDDRNRDGFSDGNNNETGNENNETGNDINGNNGGNTGTVTGDIAQGRSTYASCASSSCHNTNPAANQNGILAARNYNRTLDSIRGNRGGMGFLSSSISANEAKDIAAYLNSL